MLSPELGGAGDQPALDFDFDGRTHTYRDLDRAIEQWIARQGDATIYDASTLSVPDALVCVCAAARRGIPVIVENPDARPHRPSIPPSAFLLVATSGSTGRPRPLARTAASWYDSYPAFTAIDWVASIDSTILRVHQHGANLPRRAVASSNYANLLDEPADHAIGRSRGGLTTKAHLVVDGNGRGFVAAADAGAGRRQPDAAARPRRDRGARLEGGPPRRTPEQVIADKAYSSASNRNLLRRKGISIVIPERSDQIANRKRRGSLSGRPPEVDRTAYKRRNVVERAFSRIKQWRAIATRYDKLALAYRAGPLLALIIEWLRLLGDTA
ncbi:IS5 family transposase [Nocardia sp. NPDC050793]|uniref:IS5 family transposase n=1 Tax=Nocardia sp. NPDC050793 TaxID=3155159 RepID=UPI0034046DF0